MEMKNVLKTLRKTRGYTSAKDFCKAIGISFSTYQNYESGSRVPTVEMLVKIADFYGVTTDFLLGREPVQKPIANLNLSEENEIEVIDKYMSLPPEIRVDLMNALVKLGEIAKNRREQEQPCQAVYHARNARRPDGGSSENERRSIVLTRILRK